MATVTFNDQMGSRSILHKNLLVAAVGDQQVIFEFNGKAIPGVARIEATRYEKNGKWSFAEWTVELASGIEGFVWSQDRECGTYLGASWSQTIARVQDAAKRAGVAQDVTRAAIERFIRATFKREFVARLDEAEGTLAQPSAPVLADLLAAQEERAAATRELDAVVADVSAIEQAETDRKAAADMRDRAGKARAAMAKGASLADLKALLA